MLLIEHCDITDDVMIGDFFNEIGFQLSDEFINQDDIYMENKWPIEVLSLDGYYPIDGFRWTKPERQVRLFHRSTRVGILEDCIPYLQCSPEHVVLRKDNDNCFSWIKVCDLLLNDLIVTKNGIRKIVEIQKIDNIEQLCDLQVAIAHSYYADDVLSHNSHFLTMLGANAMRSGIDVLHYTFELSETAVGIRYDSNLCDLDSNIIIDNKDLVLEKYDQMKLGKLIIKEYPTNTATIYTIRNHVERLELQGFKPGLIIIDYADIMRSTRQFDSLRHELKLVYEELRGYASEKSIAVWTASQANKEGSTNDVIDLNNMSEAYGKAMVADVIITLSRKAHEKSEGSGRLYVAKNRAGRDGLLYNVNVDTARSKFMINGETTKFEASQDDQDELKAAIKQRWKELRDMTTSSEVEKNDNKV